MIKFFRKIRKKLLAENKISKYLAYAIGEIILVVIGILIALNINNRNELKKNEETIIKTLKEIQTNLLEDIDLSQIALDKYLLHHTTYNEILDFKTQLTQEDYKGRRADVKRRGFGTYFDDFVINKNGYENLMNHLDKVPENYEYILSDLRKLYVAQNNRIVIANERIRNTIDSYKDFIHNQNFYLDELRHGEVSKEELDYYINDDRYKNYLIKYDIAQHNVYRQSQQYRIMAIETYMKIHELLEIDDSQLPLKKLGKIEDLSSIKEYLGSYAQVNNTKTIAFKVYIEQNQLLARLTNGDIVKQYKLNNEYFVYNYVGLPILYKIKEHNDGAIIIETHYKETPNYIKIN